jgi:superoxide dismutase, Fe-Mn family
MMEQKNFYKLPELKFEYGALEPYISSDQLRIHHQKHHQAYVDNANNLLKKIDDARFADQKLDLKAVSKELSFNVGGHILHKIFWESLAPPISRQDKPLGALKTEIERNFGSFERFKREFSQAAISTEGSGWAALAFCKATKRLVILQIEKHNVNLIPTLPIIMNLDVWEHAYYLDYENERGKFVDSYWNIVNWEAINIKLDTIMSTVGK